MAQTPFDYQIAPTRQACDAAGGPGSWNVLFQEINARHEDYRLTFPLWECPTWDHPYSAVASCVPSPSRPRSSAVAGRLVYVR